MAPQQATIAHTLRASVTGNAINPPIELFTICLCLLGLLCLVVMHICPHNCVSCLPLSLKRCDRDRDPDMAPT